jgi:N12 class adenine-specific DNA methylase
MPLKTATNPKTGEKVAFVAGKWIPFEDPNKPVDPTAPVAEAAPPEPSVIQDWIVNPLKRGVGQAREAAGAGLGAAGIISPETAADQIAKGEAMVKSAPRSPEDEAAMAEIQAADGYEAAAKAALKHPKQWLLTMAESLPNSSLAILGSLVGALAGPAGIAAGAGAGSAAAEYGSSIVDAMQSLGINVSDPKDVHRALTSPKFMEFAKQRAASRATNVGALDAASGSVAGKLIAGAKGVGSAVVRGAGETGIQAGAGMVGEAAAQRSVGQDQKGDVIMEGFGEAGGIAEIAGGAYHHRNGAHPAGTPAGSTPGVTVQGTPGASPAGGAAPTPPPPAPPGGPAPVAVAPTLVPGPNGNPPGWKGPPVSSWAQPSAAVPPQVVTPPVQSPAPTVAPTAPQVPKNASSAAKKAAENVAKILKPQDAWEPVYDEAGTAVVGYHNPSTGDFRTAAEHLAPIETPLSGLDPVIKAPEEIAQAVAATKKEVADAQPKPVEVQPEAPKPQPKPAEPQPALPKAATPKNSDEERAQAIISATAAQAQHDATFEQLLAKAKETRKADPKFKLGTSWVQRMAGLGYNPAKELADKLKVHPDLAEAPAPAAAAPKPEPAPAPKVQEKVTASPAAPATFTPTHTEVDGGQSVALSEENGVRTITKADGTSRQETARKFGERYRPIGEAAPAVPEVPSVPDVPKRNRKQEAIEAAAKPLPVNAVPEKVELRPAETKPADQPTMAEIHAAGAKANPEPSQAQTDAGNYAKGHVVIHDLPIAIETAKGSYRRGTGPDGKPWSVKLDHPYGYFKGTKGKDGDPVDTYIAGRQRTAFVIDQVDPKTRAFDEHKVIFGTKNKQRAVDVYKAGFSDGSGQRRIGAITEMDVDDLREWLAKGNTTKPVGKLPEPRTSKVPAVKEAAPKVGPAKKPAADLGKNVPNGDGPERPATELAAPAPEVRDTPSESSAPEIPRTASVPAENDSQVTADTDLMAIRNKLDQIGAVRVNGIDYSLQSAGTRGNGGHYWRKVEDGVRIEKGPAGRDVWSRMLAAEKLMAEIRSDIRNAEPVAPTAQPVVQEQGGVNEQSAAPLAQPATDKEGRNSTPESAAKPEGYGGNNKVFTADAAAKARAIIKAKLNGSQLNAGFDPELALAGLTLAGYHVEAGARTFAAYSKAILEDIGENARPYLKQWYNAVRDTPDFDASGMDDAASVHEQHSQMMRPPEQAEAPAAEEAPAAPEEPAAPEAPPAAPQAARKPRKAKIKEALAALGDALDDEASPAPAENETVASKENPSDVADTAQPRPAEDDRSEDAGRSPGDVPAADGGEPPASGDRGPDAGAGGDAQPGAGGAGQPVRKGPGKRRKGSAAAAGDAAGSGVAGDGAGVPGGDGIRATPDKSAPRAKRPANYLAPLGAIERKGSWLEAARRNVEIIEKVKALGDGPVTPELQALAATYTGWGSSELANKLFPTWAARRDASGNLNYQPDSLDGPWKEIGSRLAAALTPAELETAIQSTQYAHYTSEPIVRGIWGAMQRMGFQGGKVLEPGMGIGLFPSLAPAEVAADMAYTGIEMDGLTAAIAKVISPRENVIAGDFVKRKFPDGFFDIALGNPPFAKGPILGDPAYKKFRFSLHDFFFAKALDKVRPGGLLAFVTTRYTMDKQDTKARAYMAERADFLGAIRLPNTAFKQNAGTEVVTDVLFFQRRPAGAVPGGQPWLKLAGIQAGDSSQLINEYYAAHPEMVLGRHSTAGSMYRSGEYTVLPYDDSSLGAQFAGAVAKLPQGVFQAAVRGGNERLNSQAFERDLDPGARKEGQTYVSDKGAVLKVVDGVGVPIGEVEKVSAAEHAWLKDAIGVKDLIKSAQRAQLDDAPDWQAKLDALNKAYDAFAAKHGQIQKFTSYDRKTTDEDGVEQITTYRRFKNERLILMDLEGQLLGAMEKVKDDGTISKSPFLLGRTLKKPVRPEIVTPQDALFVSLDERGKLDLPHIAELLKLSVDDAIHALGPTVMEDPAQGWQTADEYLSGDVKAKLQEAEAAAATDKERFERNVKALLEVQPAPLTPDKITVRLGAGWVPPEHIERFAEEVLGATARGVRYEPAVAHWTVPGADTQFGRGVGLEWGTADRSPLEMLDAVLNNRAIKITRTERSGGKTTTWTDADATAAANEVALKMRERFKTWAWEDAKRASDLLGIYNDQYNNLAGRQFDGSHMTLPGLSTKYTMHPHQKRAAWRIVQTGNTYLAHAVGAGKTFEMIVAAMEQRRLGLINKPMFVVPNHMLNQFASEFMEAYPAAKIMVADDKNFHTSRRQRFMAEAGLNDLDGIIITHSAFGKLGTKPETRKAIVDKIIGELEDAIESLGTGQETRITRKKLEAQVERIRQKFEAKSADETKDQGLMFEDMGVDFVNVDEAHEFRKLDYVTSQQVKGIDPNGSQKALDLFIKTRFLEAQRPGRSMVFASGTPITNTMAELYTAMRFLDEGGLERDGIGAFDAWSQMFGEVATDTEQNAAGKYEPVSRYAKFVNVPELMKRFRNFADVLTSASLGQLVERPEMRTGMPQNVVTLPSARLRQYMSGPLNDRIVKSRAWKPSPSEPVNRDPMVAIITDGRLSAIDMRYVQEDAPNDPNSKLNKMVDKIIETFKATRGDIYHTDGVADPIKGSAQIVFSPVGFGEMVAKSRGFDARAHMMARFAKAGIKPSQVAWMSDYDTDAKKQGMFKEMRDGRKVLLIGSPKNMGTGINVQKRLKALHYLGPPWYPSDVEQPHGRIIRQGNQNQVVDVHWYAAKGTYDSTGWGMVARKGRFIEQAFAGDDSVRVIDDVSEVSQYEMASALAAGDERAIRLANLNAEINKLGLLQSAHHTEQMQLRSKRDGLEGTVQWKERELAQKRSALEAAPEISEPAVTVDGAEFTKYSEAGKAILAKVKAIGDAWDGNPGERRSFPVGSINGHAIGVDFHRLGMTGKPKEYQLTLKLGDWQTAIGEAQYLEEIEARSETAPITTMVGTINKLPETVRNTEKSLAESRAELERVTGKIGAPFAQAAQVAEKTAEAAQIKAAIAEDNKQQPASQQVTTPDVGSGLEVQREIEEGEDAEDVPLTWSTDEAAGPDGKPKLHIPGWEAIDARIEGEASLDRAAGIVGSVIAINNPRDPAWVQMRQSIEADLVKLARQLAGDRISVKAFDAMRGSEQKPGEFIGGAQFQNLIRVALLDGHGNLRGYENLAGTVRHEVIHFLKASGVLPPGIWKVLEVEAATWRKTFGIDEAYRGLSEAELNEEAIAEAYNYAVNGKLKVSGAANSGFRFIRRFFAGIRDLVRKALGLKAIPTPEAIFQAIDRGDFANMAPDANGRAGALKTQLPGGAAKLLFSPTDLAANLRQLDTVNYGLLQKAMTTGMRGKTGHLFDHARRVFQDRMLHVRRLQEAVEAAIGGPIPENADPYLQETLYHGRVGEQKFRIDKDYKEPIVKAMHDAGLTIDEVDEYLTAQHAEERNDYIASINPKMPDGGSGMLTADARAHLAAVAAGNPEKARGLAQVSALVRQMMDARIDLMETSGLIDSGVASIYRTQYQHYVPLRGKDADPDPEMAAAMRPKTGRGFMGIRRLEPRAYGRGEGNRAPNILATTFTLADEAIVRAEKNEVALAVLNLASLAPDPNVWSIAPVERQAYMANVLDPTTGKRRPQVRYRTVPHNDPADTVLARVGGQAFRVQIHEPYFLRAISNLGAQELGPILRTLSTVTGTLSKLNTMWSPEFLITNAFMDAQAGLVNLNQEDRAGLKRAVLGHWGSAFRGARHYLSTGDTSTPWAAHARDFRAAGGATAFNDMSDVQSKARDLEQTLKDLSSAKASIAKRALKKLGHGLDVTNGAVDNAIRLSTFVALRDRGYTVAQAARVAKNLTINFNRKGELGPAANALFMFANAGIQGTAVLATALKHKNVRRFVYAAVAMGVAQELMGGGWEPPDDDPSGLGLSVYDMIPEWEKRTNMIIPYGHGQGDYFKVRMPYGYGFFHSFGRLIAAYLRGAREDTGKPVGLAMSIGKLFEAFAQNMIPPGLGDVFVPTVAAPFVQIAENKDWTGRPIGPTQFPGQEKPDSQSYFPSINPAWKWIAAELNALTGGNEFRPGLVDVSPESMSHVLNVYAGAAGAMAYKAFSVISRASSEAMGLNSEDSGWSMNDVPMVRRMIGASSPWQAKDVTYQRIGELEILADEAKADPTIKPQHRRELALVDDARKARKELGEFNKTRRRILADEKLSPAQRREKVAGLAEREKGVMQRFNQRYMRAVSQPAGAPAPP